VLKAAATPDRERALPRARLGRLWLRFVDIVRGVAVSPADQLWIAALLEPPEHVLWSRLSPHDQHHAVQVARGVERRLAGTPYAGDGRWLAAALLHDVGKAEAGLSAAERAFATLLGKAASVATARRWALAKGGPTRRIGLYLTHGPTGAALIRGAGGREEVAAWAEVHQALPCPGSELLPGPVAQALSDSDLE
jgi:hypothetical protein